ncbi:MAG TPA: hypothetical protein VEX60_18380 [Pyrinomonadaceae bacterium]|nr:hypothetical protein [Pyrinomonadaceae bacterium]
MVKAKGKRQKAEVKEASHRVAFIFNFCLLPFAFRAADCLLPSFALHLCQWFFQTRSPGRATFDAGRGFAS